MTCRFPALNHLSQKGESLRNEADELDPTQGHDTSISNPFATPVARSANDALAANLSATFPKTPQRATPNSSKKRRHIPDLSRSIPTSSHRTRISMIFQDAAVTLQDIRSPLCGASSNIQRSRIPVSQARTTRFGSTGRESTAGVTNHNTLALTHKDSDSSIGHVQNRRLDQQPRPPTRTASADLINQGLLEDYQVQLPALNKLSSSSPMSTTASVSLQNRGKDKSKEPISSGFATPSALYSQPAETPEEVSYPEFRPWQLPWSSSIPGADGGNYIPSRGVSLALPPSSPHTEENHGTSIEKWLNDVQTLIDAEDGDLRIVQQQTTGMYHLAVDSHAATSVTMAVEPSKQREGFAIPLPKQRLPEPSSTSSDKENVSPPRSTPLPSRPPFQYLAETPSRFRSHRVETANSARNPLHFDHLQTPQGQFNEPPKRKKARVGRDARPGPRKMGRDFTIHDDQIADALAQLSPDVELRRKGRRPKRVRCLSYWDEDILHPSSPCAPMNNDENAAPTRKGRKVLGESKETAELTKEKPFVKEIEDAAFDFQVSSGKYGIWS